MDGEIRRDRPLILVQHNSEERPCLWVRAPSPMRIDEAKQWLIDHWPTHGGSGCGCYPGEQKGDLVTIDEESGLEIDRVRPLRDWLRETEK